MKLVILLGRYKINKGRKEKMDYNLVRMQTSQTMEANYQRKKLTKSCIMHQR